MDSERENIDKFDYSSDQMSQQGGKKIMHKVIIKQGKGFKMITHYKNGKKMYSKKKPLKPLEISHIQMGKFIPGLFKECKACSRKTRKHRK
jgi:hypothetical protein